jgi:hypothetical protein
MAVGIVLNRNRKVPAEETPAFGAIAERFRRAGDLERAVALCQDGLRRFPDHLSARVTLGWSLLDLGKYEEAREALEQVLKRAPDNLAAIRGLAELHDRAEHTMMLPMDGPGQWPPSIDETEEVVEPPAAAAANRPAAAARVDHVAAVADTEIDDDAGETAQELTAAFEFPPPLAIPTSSQAAAIEAEHAGPMAEPAVMPASDFDIDLRLEAAPDETAAAIDAVAALSDQAIALEEATAFDGEALGSAGTEQDVPVVEIAADEDLSAVESEMGLGTALDAALDADMAAAGAAPQQDDPDEIAALEALIAQARALEEPEFQLTAQSVLELISTPPEEEADGDELDLAADDSQLELPLIAAFEIHEPALPPDPEPEPELVLAHVPAVKPAVIALERFLRRVQARRLSLASGSVA